VRRFLRISIMAYRYLALCVAIIVLTAFSYSQVKKPTTPLKKIPFERSLQAVVVTTPDWNSVQGTARLFERKSTRSQWKAVGGEFPIVVGRSGLGDDPSIPKGVTGQQPPKHEGDGRSPAGFFQLTSTFGNSDAGSKLPFTKLNEFTECVDDTKSNFYNQIVNRMQVGNFDWKSSEKMLAVGPQYDLGVFVAYNSYPAIRGNGSCIFLHIWKDASTGTSGCTAMARENLERIVKWLDPAKNPYLVQMTEAEYLSQQSLKLPKLK
jgi:L,D-peptidoglycan transpeptidase YkuD (ErfK/YbiS/YcfS/YnhG family)